MNKGRLNNTSCTKTTSSRSLKKIISHATHQISKRTKAAANILKKIYRYQITKKILPANHRTFTSSPPKSVYFKKTITCQIWKKKFTYKYNFKSSITYLKKFTYKYHFTVWNEISSISTGINKFNALKMSHQNPCSFVFSI